MRKGHWGYSHWFFWMPVRCSYQLSYWDSSLEQRMVFIHWHSWFSGWICLLKVLFYSAWWIPKHSPVLSNGNTVVSRKYTPLFALVQNAGGAYINVGCDNFSRDYALPPCKAWPHCQWGGGSHSARQRDTPDASVGWWASALRGEKAGCFRKVAGVSIVDVGGPCSR